MNDTPPVETILHGKSEQVRLLVLSAMSDEANRKLHFQKDPVRGEHHRIRSTILLTAPEKEKVLDAITKSIPCRKATIETAKWTKAWLTTTKGTVIRLYL